MTRPPRPPESSPDAPIRIASRAAGSPGREGRKSLGLILGLYEAAKTGVRGSLAPQEPALKNT